MGYVDRGLLGGVVVDRAAEERLELFRVVDRRLLEGTGATQIPEQAGVDGLLADKLPLEALWVKMLARNHRNDRGEVPGTVGDGGAGEKDQVLRLLGGFLGAEGLF